MTVTPFPRRLYLDHALETLEPFLARSDVTDIHINRPSELWLEMTHGGQECHSVPALSATLLDRIVSQVAAISSQGINRTYPLLSAILPDGARLQAVIPPATRGDISISIRKHQALDRRLEDYAPALALMQSEIANNPKRLIDLQLKQLQKAGDFASLLRLATQSRRNILISGGTATGKTTFLNALLREVDLSERIILIEDTPEISIEHPNSVGLLAARSEISESTTTANDLVGAALRMRPDRIILGEIRGAEAFAFLRAVNTGHPGSMTTVHADSPERVLEQLALLVLQSGTTLRREDVVSYARSTIDVYVQLSRIGGARRITEVMLREDMT